MSTLDTLIEGQSATIQSFSDKFLSLKLIEMGCLPGETVKLSSFGSFIVREKGERIGRNPKTGVEVPITPRRVLVFKPSNVMKARINGDDTAAED